MNLCLLSNNSHTNGLQKCMEYYVHVIPTILYKPMVCCPLIYPHTRHSLMWVGSTDHGLLFPLYDFEVNLARHTPKPPPPSLPLPPPPPPPPCSSSNIILMCDSPQEWCALTRVCCPLRTFLAFKASL